MRDIRFRAWDIDNKRMYDCNFLPVYAFDDSRHPIMQYTGLKDKNGKEIYIGDIVKHYDNRIRKVQWIDTTMNTGVSDFVSDGECGSPDPEDIEVIGNIWENPELLEK